MILAAASSLYGAAAQWRRSWYARHPALVRTLEQPVISVGNLTAGGSGKTPVVAAIARLLLDGGERPSILTRGYARRSFRDGVTVVSDRSRVLAALDTAGDEALMLARALPGVPVLVGPDRFLSGRLAEERFEATVHLLDDGFQQLALVRDIDLLLVSGQDLDDRVIPAGRLREPLATAAAADAVLVSEDMPDDHGGAAIVERLLPDRGSRALAAFAITRRIAEVPPALIGVPVLAVAGIARPGRFFTDLTAAGWSVAGTLAFRDHHAFRARDLTRIAVEARRAGAVLIVTTEKDAIRFEACDFGPLELQAIALTTAVEPAAGFREWLLQRIGAVRGATAAATPPHQQAGRRIHRETAASATRRSAPAAFHAASDEALRRAASASS